MAKRKPPARAAEPLPDLFAFPRGRRGRFGRFALEAAVVTLSVVFVLVALGLVFGHG